MTHFIAIHKVSKKVYEVESITFSPDLWNGRGMMLINYEGKERSVPNDEYDVYLKMGEGRT